MDIVLENLERESTEGRHENIASEVDHGVLYHKYIPSMGQPGNADVEYACVVLSAQEDEVAAPEFKMASTSSKANIKFDARDWEALHIISGLAEIPIYGIVSARVIQGVRGPDMSSAWRIE
jgi:hypothetical protein